MRLLLIADVPEPALWDHYRPSRLKGYDLILSAGDLKAEYLEFLVTMANRPLIYVCGNHDGSYQSHSPEGCACAEDTIVTVNGLRILGLGGSGLYNGGPYQYSERQMEKRIRRLHRKIKKAGGVDLVLTHAPIRGFGDDDTLAHRGFEAFRQLVDDLHPNYWVHGHVHLNYNTKAKRVLRCGDTTIINACGCFVLDTEKDPEEYS